MADPLNPQPQRNYLDDILDQAFDDLEMERQRQENIINAPDPAKRLGEVQKIEKRVENEVPEVQDAVRKSTYQDISYYGGGAGKLTQTKQQVEPLIKPGLRPGEVNQWQGFFNAIKSGYKQGQMARNVIGLEGGLEAEERLKEIASLQAEIRGIPRSKAYNEFNKADTFGKALKTLAVDPIEITSQLVVESLASFLPTQIAGMLTGAGIGAGVGSVVPGIGTIAGAGSGALYGGITSAGLTSLGLEYSGKMLEVMGELGVNVEDPNDLARGFSDEKIMSEARELGLRKGVPIAIFDLVSAGVAGRFMKPGKSLASKAIQGSKEVGTQAVLGSTGEATGQLSAGEEIQPSAIIAEGIAEIGQSAPSGATRLATQKFKSQKLEKAKAKGLEAIETGQLRQLTDQDITNFIRSLTKEEAMEIGIAQETGKIEVQSELGKEMIRRDLDMEKFPETLEELREAKARKTIKEQKMEGKDFVGELINKAESESGIAIEREYLDRTLADEAEQEGWTEEETKQVLRDHGINEETDPNEITISGTSFGGSIRISTAGTEKRMADEYVAVQEEMAEEYYKAEQENNPEFENEVAEDRRKYHEATGEQDTGESNLEWFSSKAIQFSTQGKVHQSIGAKLTEIFNRFIDNARIILKDAFKLRKAIREGKVSDSLLKKLEEATDFKKVGEKVQQAKLSKSKRDPDGGISYRVTEVGNVEPTGVFLIGADMVARDLDGKLDPFGLRYTENYNGFALSKAGATKLVNRGKEGFNTVAVVAYDQIKGSQEANPSFQNRVKKELAKSVGKRRTNKLLKDNDNDVKKVAGIVNKEIQEFNQKKPKAKKKPKINLTQIALDNAEPDAPQLRRKIVYVGTLKEIRTGKDRFRKHEVYPAEQIFDNLVELKEPIPIDNLIEELPDSDMRKKNWGMMVTQTNFLMTTDESNIAKQLVEMAQTGKDVFTGTPNPDFQFFSRETEDTTPEQAVERAEGERQFKARQFTSQVDEELGLGTATRSTVGFTEEYGDESAMVSRFFGKQDQELLNYRGALIGLMFNQIDVTNFIGSEDGPHSLLKITIDQTDLIGLKKIMQKNGISNKTIRIRGNQQDILLWDMGDLNNNLIHAIADKYNAKEYTEQKGEFQFLTNESSRKEARKRFIGIIQDYQSKTNSGLPKAVSKFLPDFYKRKADRDRLLKQLKAKPKPSYRLAPTFYSKAERVVTEQFPPTMKSQSVENFLKKNQVKPEEIQWLDLETLLKGKQKVTKEKLQEWIQANKIDVKDVMLGESFTLDEERSLTKNEYIKMFEQVDPAYPDEEPGNALDDGETLEFVNDGIYYDFKIIKAEDKEYAVYKDQWEDDKFTVQKIETENLLGYKSLGAIIERRVDDEDAVKRIIGNLSYSATRHSSYQLPGEKEDYRELLLTLPEKKQKEMTDDEWRLFRELEDKEELGVLTTEEIFQYNRLLQIQDNAYNPEIQDPFISGHYDEPNILAHVRFNTRKTPTGEKVLFIEELQSDWHTKGREKGYKKSIPPDIKVEISKLMSDYQKIINEKNDIKVKSFSTLFPSTEAEKKKGNKKRKLLKQKINQLDWKAETLLNKAKELKELEISVYGKNTGVPDAPFKGNGWIELIMKRMLRYASENNFDRIAWTTANQQIDRWKDELRQNVDQISWQKYNSDVYYPGSDKFIYNNVVINGLKKNDNVFNQTIPIEGETTINGQKVTLEGLLGKQMATQIRNSEDRTGVIEGDDLTVGGQGFKVVYDFAIKKILNKMGKKFNAKVDQAELIELTTKSPILQMKDEGYKQIERPELDKLTTFTQPSIPITRKMKESALKGQPTFRASKMTSTDDVLSSPSFKKWFKGSQVKDKDGKPLVVYHGTDKSFDKFKIGRSGGIYFTEDSDFATNFGNTVIPVYLKINKLADLTNRDSNEFKMAVKAFNDSGGWSEQLDDINSSSLYPRTNPDYEPDSDLSWEIFDHPDGSVRDYLINDGYDGVKLEEYGDGNESIVVFEPTQIKSVFNKGTFNPHDPRISFRMAPTNLVTPLAKIYQEQKGTKKSYTKKDFELDLVRLGYPEETLKTAMDLFGIIRIKQIETDEPTPIEKELKKIQDLHITRSNLKDRIKRAYRLGAVEKEKEINKLQKIVTNYARKNLPKGIYSKSEVTGLLAKVRDAKRARELATALERIDRIIDKVNKRSALAKWNKTVKKKATVKRVGGIGRGKVGADVQDIVNDIRGKKKGEGIMDLSPADVELKIELMGEVMEASEDGEPTDDQALQLNLLITYGAMKHKTPEEITRATEQFDELVTAGRMQVIEDQEAYKERMKEIGDEILEVITGGAGSQTQAGAQRIGLKKDGLIAEIKETLSTFDSHNQSLEYIFDKLSRLDKTSKPLESAINNYFMPMIRQARLSEYNGLVEMNTMLRENAERIFKVKGRKLTRRLNENTVNTIRIDHRNGEDGVMTFSDLTYNQAYKKWMELMDPTLENTFKKMGWDVNKTKRQIEDQLPKDMIKWAEWQLYEFYPMYYQRVNEVFRKRFNVNMPFNPMYSPISRRIGARADEGDDTLNKSKSPMGSMTSAGSLKGRVSNVEELAWVDGDTAIMKHITEMEHFIHYTQVMREMRSVFMNRNISRSISDFHGNGISRTLNKFMDDIARGGVDRSQNLEWIDKLRANFSRSVIGVNPVVYLKQLASIPAYMADIPMLDWSTEFAKVFNPVEFKRMYRTLSKSKMVEMRYDQGFERDMVLALQNQKPGKLISGTDFVNTFAYAFTKMGDKQAIFLGGWAVYKYHKKKALKEGKSLKDAEAIAMRKFEEASLRSQQASDVEDLADFQRRGSLAKLFTMFMTSPNQYYRMVIGGYRNLRAGRGSKSENLRKIFVGQFLLPTLFQFISNGFKWDDEDQAVSILLFPFSGLLFVGQAFEYMIRSAFDLAYPMGPVSILDPFVDIGKGLKKTFDGKEFTTKKVFQILDDYIGGLSKVFGVPYSGPKRSIENAIKVAKEGSEYPIRESIGFRMKEEKKKKKKKKPKVGGPVYAY